MCLEELRKSLTSVRYLSSLEGGVAYHSLALQGWAKGEREEHLSQKQQLVQMHRGVNEWSKFGKLEAGDLAWLWGGEQAVACTHNTG